MSADDPVTALVVVRPAVAGSFSAAAPIDRTNLASVSPRPDDVERVASAMRGRGFDVGPMIGVSMSITAPRPTFESAFDVELVDRDGGWEALGRDRSSTTGRPAASDERDADDATRDPGERAPDDRRVPLDSLPRTLADCIECIVFEPPRTLHQGETWTF